MNEDEKYNFVFMGAGLIVGLIAGTAIIILINVSTFEPKKDNKTKYNSDKICSRYKPDYDELEKYCKEVHK